MAKPISRKELIRRFRSLGFEGPISGGRHQFMQKGTLKVRIPNPHKSDTIDGSLVKEILGQASIGFDRWDKA
jgi:predicted RNA binding protein YcfA (HicA-like mRNA interferase family)